MKHRFCVGIMDDMSIIYIRRGARWAMHASPTQASIRRLLRALPADNYLFRPCAPISNTGSARYYSWPHPATMGAVMP